MKTITMMVILVISEFPFLFYEIFIDPTKNYSILSFYKMRIYHVNGGRNKQEIWLGVRISKLIKFRCYWDISHLVENTNMLYYMELWVLYIYVDVLVVSNVFIYLKFSDKYNNEVKTNSSLWKKYIFFVIFPFIWTALFVLCQIIDKLLVIIYLSLCLSSYSNRVYIRNILCNTQSSFSSTISIRHITNININWTLSVNFLHLCRTNNLYGENVQFTNIINIYREWE